MEVIMNPFEIQEGDSLVERVHDTYNRIF
jgi:hypothetical protein